MQCAGGEICYVYENKMIWLRFLEDSCVFCQNSFQFRLKLERCKNCMKQMCGERHTLSTHRCEELKIENDVPGIDWNVSGCLEGPLKHKCHGECAPLYCSIEWMKLVSFPVWGWRVKMPVRHNYVVLFGKIPDGDYFSNNWANFLSWLFSWNVGVDQI